MTLTMTQSGILARGYYNVSPSTWVKLFHFLFNLNLLSWNQPAVEHMSTDREDVAVVIVKNKRRTAAAHPRSAFLSDYANSLAIDYIIIRSIFGTTKSVLSSSRCRVKSHRHEGKVYCTTHGRFIDVVVLMANIHQHIQTRMVFPLFATDDYPFSIFHFPFFRRNKHVEATARMRCLFSSNYSTHSTDSPIRKRRRRRRRIHVECLHLPMK